MHGDSRERKKGCWYICACRRVLRGVGVIIILIINIDKFCSAGLPKSTHLEQLKL